MKASHLSLFLAIVGVVLPLMASCEKMSFGDEVSGGEGEQSNVSLHVGSIGMVPFAARTRAEVGSVSSRLNFALYDGEGKRVKQINQKEGDADYGNPSFFMPEGKYLLVVVAHNSNGNPTMTNPQKINFSNTQGYTDTFLYADSLQVDETGVRKDLSLKRIVAKVRFMVDNPIPAGTKQIQFYYTGGAGTFSALTGYGSVKSKQAVIFDVEGSERQFEIFTIPHAELDTLEVQVSTYDANTTPITQKTISKVPVQRNRITICRGNLFDEQAEGTRAVTFTLAVDDAWGDNLQMDY